MVDPYQAINHTLGKNVNQLGALTSFQILNGTENQENENKQIVVEMGGIKV